MGIFNDTVVSIGVAAHVDRIGQQTIVRSDRGDGSGYIHRGKTLTFGNYVAGSQKSGFCKKQE